MIIFKKITSFYFRAKKLQELLSAEKLYENSHRFCKAKIFSIFVAADGMVNVKFTQKILLSFIKCFVFEE